mgnify:CR=1 FL=1
MTEHTKTPWHPGHIGEDDCRREVVFDKHSGQVCEITMTGDVGVADAAFVVRACNAHAGLVAALRRCIPIDGRSIGLYEMGWKAGRLHERGEVGRDEDITAQADVIHAVARAALAKAEEGVQS